MPNSTILQGGQEQRRLEDELEKDAVATDSIQLV
jgi:hypothetical protein